MTNIHAFSPPESEHRDTSKQDRHPSATDTTEMDAQPSNNQQGFRVNPRQLIQGQAVTISCDLPEFAESILKAGDQIIFKSEEVPWSYCFTPTQIGTIPLTLSSHLGNKYTF